MTDARHPFAVRVHAHGGPEVLKTEPIELGNAGPHEVLVRHEAVGLNFIDTYFRSGLYPAPLPTGLGNEAAGVVETVGDAVSDWKPGDRVGYFTGPLGAYATHRLVDSDRLVRLPASVPFDQAAAAMLKGCTAEYLVERCARVEAGQSVLVHAAAGGVGSILVQWLKSVGARVIAHSGSAEKAAMATSFGADHSLHCPMPELAAAVRGFTDGAGVATVFDGVGAASWSASLDSVARCGLIVSYGNASGTVPPFTPLDLMRKGSIFVTRPTLFDYCPTPEAIRGSAARLFEMMERGAVEILIGQRFDLREAADAHRAIEGRSTKGSTILIP